MSISLYSTAGYDSGGSHNYLCPPVLCTFHQDLFQVLWSVSMHDVLHADCGMPSCTQALHMGWH